MNPRSLILLSATAVLSLVTLACDANAPTTPQLGVPDGPSAIKTQARKRVKLRNKDRYADKGDQGIVASEKGVKVAARAYALKDGTTILEMVAGRFNKPEGRIHSIAYAVVDPRGKRLTRRDLYRALESAPEARGGLRSARMTFRGIARGSRFNLDLFVRRNNNAAGLRLSAPVRFGPDLAVTSVDVPEHVHATEVVAINATVRELNGQMGARGDCVLYADGAEVDRAEGISVDAGGTVTCAFAARFQSLGVKSLRAAVVTSAPTEYDPANNSSSLSVNVEPLPLNLSYTAEVLQHTGLFLDDYRFKYDDDPVTGFGFHSTFTLNNSVDERYQYARIFASAPQGVGFPVASVAVSQSTDGVPLHSRTYTDLAGGTPFGTADDGGTCAEDGDGAFAFILCSYHRRADTWTTIYYQQYSGTVVFISRQLATWTAPWGHDDGEPGYFESSEKWGNYIPYGASVTINVDVTSGLFRLAASPSITLTTNDFGDTSNHCVDTPLDHGLARECFDIKRTFQDRAGVVVKGE